MATATPFVGQKCRVESYGFGQVIDVKPNEPGLPGVWVLVQFNPGSRHEPSWFISTMNIVFDEQSRPTVFTVLKKDYPSQWPYYALCMHGARRDGVSFAEFGEETPEQVIQKVQGKYSDGQGVQMVSEEQFYRIQGERKAAHAGHTQI